MTGRRRRDSRSRTTAGDMLRIPVGVVFLCLAVTAVRKAIQVFRFDVIHIVILIFALAVALVFALIGLVMALGWVGKIRKRAPKASEPPSEEGAPDV